MTPLLSCMPVCLLFISLGLVAFAVVLSGMVQDVPPDPNAPPPEPSTFPGWKVTLLIFAAVAFVMWVLTEIAAPSQPRPSSLMPPRLSAAVVVALLASLPSAPPVGAQPAAEWKQTWVDEFDGAAIDPAKWDFDLGSGFFNYDANQWISGWGNNELQYYTKEATNAFVKDGVLHVRAVKESYQGSGYTSARLRSKKRDGTQLFAQRYGKFEFKAKLPTGKGVWPALWMLPQDDKYGPWPTSGEIDVMEARGQEPTKVLGTLHYGSRWPANVHAGKEYVFPAGQSIADWHTYGVEWEPGEIRWAVDGKGYGSLSFWWSSAKTAGTKGVAPAGEADVLPWPAPFDQPFYVVMNVAVGGQFLGNPDRTTVFPAEMLVDYVRAYEKPGGYGAVRPRGAGRFPFMK